MTTILDKILDAYFSSIRNAITSITEADGSLSGRGLGETLISCAIGFAASMGMPKKDIESIFAKTLEVMDREAAAADRRAGLHIITSEVETLPAPPRDE